MMIRNILFDMGGVVFRQNTEEAFRRFHAAGIPNVEEYMGKYGQKDFFLDIETGKIDAAAFCRRMAEVAGRENVSFEEAQYCWLGFFIDVPEERIDNLVALRQNYHVCLLSNTNPFIMDFMRSPLFSASGRTINDCFDRQFCSYEIHAYKPNPEIFQLALRTDGMRAEECVFLDDSEKNVRAAAALGMRTILVEGNGDWMPALRRELARD